MWASLKLFFSTNAAAIMGKAALLAAVVMAVYRAGGKAQENEHNKKELEHAKEALAQDAVVAGNSDVSGMRDRLSAALRRKRDS